MTLTRVRRRVDQLVFGDDYDRADGRCRQGPEWLVLVINNFCNLRCRMCDVGLGESESVFYTHLIGDDPRNMSLDLLVTILEQAEFLSPKPKVGLAFTEPLIHRDILAFCREIVERGCFCSITTNGWMLPRLADHLVAIGVQEITVSVNGPDEVHDQVRGKAGSFHKLFSGVEAVNEARKRLGKESPLIRFSYTLTDMNYTHMTAFLKRVAPLQPASVTFSHLNFITS